MNVLIPGLITSPPVDSASCYGGIATFHCGSDRGSDIKIITWIIDSEDVAEYTSDDLVVRSTHTSITDDYAASNLTIVGLTSSNDGIDIGCSMVDGSFAINTETATFTVIDIPPVTDLSIEFTGTIMNITWDAPTLLPVDYHYQINITDGNINVTGTNTSTSTVYSVSVSSCSTNYTVSVSVVDIGYTQRHSEPVETTEQSSGTAGSELYASIMSTN